MTCDTKRTGLSQFSTVSKIGFHLNLRGCVYLLYERNENRWDDNADNSRRQTGRDFSIESDGCCFAVPGNLVFRARLALRRTRFRANERNHADCFQELGGERGRAAFKTDIMLGKKAHGSLLEKLARELQIITNHEISMGCIGWPDLIVDEIYGTHEIP